MRNIGLNLKQQIKFVQYFLYLIEWLQQQNEFKTEKHRSKRDEYLSL